MTLLLVTYLAALVVAAVGLATYMRASKTPPNVQFGFRAAPALVSRRLWRKINRLAGLMAIADAMLVFPLSLLLDEVTLLVCFALSLPVLEGILAAYSRLVLEREAGLDAGGHVPLRKLPVIKVDVRVVLVAAVVMVGTVAALLWAGRFLPERVAAHFDLAGRPNLYMHRESFLLLFSAAYSAIVAGLSLLLLSCGGVPLVPWARDYQEELERVLRHALLAVSVLLPGVAFLIIQYNIHGKHVVDMNLAALALVCATLGILLKGLIGRRSSG